MKKAARVIESQKEEIMDIWVKRVREELHSPSETTDLVLRDHLPLLLDDMITIMKEFDKSEVFTEKKNFHGMLNHSTGHGRHRSSSFGYDVEQVLKEYIILHSIVTTQLRAKNAFSTEVADVLKNIIENSMLFSIGAFNKSVQEVRQKLLAILAHDIRNPVSAAHLSLGMLRQEDDAERFEKIKEISRKSIRRALNLIEDLLESVSVEAGEGLALNFTECDLAECIRSVYGEASEIYSNPFILNCEEEKIIGVFDSAMVRRVLENIISNAVKYGKRGTPITITVKDSAEEVVLDVHNEGDPIPQENQEEIFKFLNTTRGHGPRSLKSWGMGLTLVNVVAEAHGGKLSLESTKEKGTTFSLLLKKHSTEPGKRKTALNFKYGADRTATS